MKQNKKLKYLNRLTKKQLDQLLKLLNVRWKGAKDCVFKYKNYNDKFIEVSVKYPDTMHYIWLNDYSYGLIDKTEKRTENFYNFMKSIFGPEYEKDYKNYQIYHMIGYLEKDEKTM